MLQYGELAPRSATQAGTKAATWRAQLCTIRTRDSYPGVSDEPLKGKRSGQRSIRLNKSYRAIYVINRDGGVEIVEVQEVNKHEY